MCVCVTDDIVVLLLYRVGSNVDLISVCVELSSQAQFPSGNVYLTFKTLCDR